MSTQPDCRLISIGAVHQDTIAHARINVHRETSTPARFNTRPGGVATNIARTVSRLGVDTTLIGLTGTDAAARELADQLTDESLKLELVQRNGFATGRYLALHDPDGSLAAACVDDTILTEAPETVFDGVIEAAMQNTAMQTIWFLDANLPEEMLVHVVGKLGKGFLFANAVSDAKAPRLRKLLPKIDCLTLNHGEAAALLQKAPSSAPQDLANALIETGLRKFVLTGGRDALLVQTGTGIEKMVPPSTEIIDVTGAGDALTAGTIAALARGFTLNQAVPYGMRAAQLTLQSTGAFAQHLSWDAL
ncbi:PfkB family carbohydrate kinase [uncultured Roseibium sp.]|uniref:PfkB family carbohydrate kinase n=1 Tax=uncultured Roseibium sp. TaxID=1936171 RepID=UPI002637EABE|nr:PfkB family carbohydrate kinase [uncultured Roseibium sp.]